MTDAHRPDTPALLTGEQEQAVKHHHLVPEVIFALIYPEKWKQLCLAKKTTDFFVFNSNYYTAISDFVHAHLRVSGQDAS